MRRHCQTSFHAPPPPPQEPRETPGGPSPLLPRTWGVRAPPGAAHALSSLHPPHSRPHPRSSANFKVRGGRGIQIIFTRVPAAPSLLVSSHPLTRVSVGGVWRVSSSRRGGASVDQRLELWVDNGDSRAGLRHRARRMARSRAEHPPPQYTPGARAPPPHTPIRRTLPQVTSRSATAAAARELRALDSAFREFLRGRVLSWHASTRSSPATPPGLVRGFSPRCRRAALVCRRRIALHPPPLAQQLRCLVLLAAPRASEVRGRVLARWGVG